MITKELSNNRKPCDTQAGIVTDVIIFTGMYTSGLSSRTKPKKGYFYYGAKSDGEGGNKFSPIVGSNPTMPTKSSLKILFLLENAKSVISSVWLHNFVLVALWV